MKVCVVDKVLDFYLQQKETGWGIQKALKEKEERSVGFGLSLSGNRISHAYALNL